MEAYIKYCGGGASKFTKRLILAMFYTFLVHEGDWRNRLDGLRLADRSDNIAAANVQLAAWGDRLN